MKKTCSLAVAITAAPAIAHYLNIIHKAAYDKLTPVLPGVVGNMGKANVDEAGQREGRLMRKRGNYYFSTK